MMARIAERIREERENRIPNLIRKLEAMEPFCGDPGRVPEPPVMERELYERHVVPNYIRCGAIPKDRLVEGKTYVGSCRNAEEAVWNGRRFEYTRRKFGYDFTDRIGSFDGDDGCTTADVFVPIAIKNEGC